MHEISPKLVLYTGPMFSGKTTELVKLLGSYAKNGVKSVLIKSSLDTRMNLSHLNQDLKNFEIVAMNEDNENDFFFDFSNFSKFAVFGIDEAHFFGTKLKQMVEVLLEKRKAVYVAGLIGDFNQKGFDSVLEIMPMCDDIKFLKPFCKNCVNTEASFSVLKRNTGTGASDSTNIVVGGSETYLVLCRVCLNKSNEEKN